MHDSTQQHPNIQRVYISEYSLTHTETASENETMPLKSERVGPGVLTRLVSMSQMEVRSQSGDQWPSWIGALFVLHYGLCSHFYCPGGHNWTLCCHCFENERERGRWEERWTFFLLSAAWSWVDGPVNWWFN